MLIDHCREMAVSFSSSKCHYQHKTNQNTFHWKNMVPAVFQKMAEKYTVCQNEIEYSVDKRYYYSTNCNTIQIWSWCSRYLSSVGNRYLAVYIASYVGRKSEVKKSRCPERFKNVTSFVINLLNNKTIILLNLAEYRLILANSAYGLIG